MFIYDHFLVFLSPCSDFHDRIMPVFHATPPEGIKIRVIQYRFLALSLVSEFSPDFLKLLIRLCTVDDPQFVFVVFLQIGKSLPSLLLKSSTSLRFCFYIQSCFCPGLRNAGPFLYPLKDVLVCMEVCPTNLNVFFGPGEGYTNMGVWPFVTSYLAHVHSLQEFGLHCWQ